MPNQIRSWKRCQKAVWILKQTSKSKLDRETGPFLVPEAVFTLQCKRIFAVILNVVIQNIQKFPWCYNKWLFREMFCISGNEVSIVITFFNTAS